MKTIFSLITKSGALTSYAFACGYVKTGKTKAGTEITLDKRFGTYNIRSGTNLFSFYTLKLAQKRFCELKRQIA